MAVRKDYAEFVKNQLSEFGKVEFKNMFGGIGIFKEGVMFAKIGGDKFRLKVSDANKKQFEERGMNPFYSEKKKKGMPYWEVPPEILENKELLAEWASQSYEIALKSKK